MVASHSLFSSFFSVLAENGSQIEVGWDVNWKWLYQNQLGMVKSVGISEDNLFSKRPKVLFVVLYLFILHPLCLLCFASSQHRSNPTKNCFLFFHFELDYISVNVVNLIVLFLLIFENIIHCITMDLLFLGFPFIFFSLSIYKPHLWLGEPHPLMTSLCIIFLD